METRDEKRVERRDLKDNPKVPLQLYLSLPIR